MKARPLPFVLSILLVLIIFHTGTVPMKDKIKTSISTSSSFTGISINGTKLTITMEGQIILKDCALTFQYMIVNQPGLHDFASSVTNAKIINASVNDALGTGTKYNITYESTNITVVLQITLYPSSDEIIANATVTPVKNFTLQSDLSLFSLNTVDLLPSIPRDELKFS
ncbi:MAG TPA: hypothetical protein VKM55_19435 [Candidatus Lokiarchaeia archaeon]|nr:hypothetical protein [Candidatus Lokiarchaeia archaeon]